VDETVKAIIERIALPCNPPKIMHGRPLTMFYDCVQLSPNDLARLAAVAMGDVDEGSFDAVIGLAYGGILFAAAVAGGKQVAIFTADGHLVGPPIGGKRVYLIADVIETGAHVQVAAKVVSGIGGIIVGVACIVDRTAGRTILPGLSLLSATTAV